MTVDIANQTAVFKKLGRTGIFIGNECQNWSLADWAVAARRAQSFGFDVIIAKVADGGNKWYGSPGNLVNIYHTITSQGPGFVPFTYCYGPRISSAQIDDECAILNEVQNAIATTQDDGVGFVCADMEEEWNGRIDAAQRFAGHMTNKHQLYLTSWANPQAQAWGGVLNVLRGCINAYIPQEYDDYLNSAEYQQISQDINIIPAVDLSYEFSGNNHPVAIAQNALNHGHKTVWAWEWVFLNSYAGNANMVVNTMRQEVAPDPTTTPTPNPVSPPVPTQKMASITFREGDALSGNVINEAHALGFEGATWQDLYTVVKQHLDEVANDHGQRDSQSGNDIYIGDTITFPVR